MLAYYGTQLSPHMDRTPEGYLICRDVPIARTGQQQYLARELQLDGDPDRIVTVNRHPEDVFDAAVLASFEGKDVTSPHPPENLSPENFLAYTKGHVERVRRSGDYIVADLIIKDANLVNDVWNGTLREVSCGYTCQYVPDGEGFKQQHIRGNHVAVVPRGRAGHEVAIQDQAVYEAEKGSEAMENENLETKTTPTQDTEPEVKPETKPEGANEVNLADSLAALTKSMDALSKRMEALEGKDSKPALSDEKTIDAMIEQLGGAPSVTIPADEKPEMSPAAKDAAVTLLRTMRPIVAGIKDIQDRARVVDALLGSIKGPDMMRQVMTAVNANAQQAADADQASTFEARCKESEAAYAARNPHKKEEN